MVAGSSVVSFALKFEIARALAPWEKKLDNACQKNMLRQGRFPVIEQTLKNPTRVVESTKEKNVVLYEKCFDDYSIANTVLSTAYVYVVVNWSTGIIRTVYDNPRRRTHGKVLWPKTR